MTDKIRTKEEMKKVLELREQGFDENFIEALMREEKTKKNKKKEYTEKFPEAPDENDIFNMDLSPWENALYEATCLKAERIINKSEGRECIIMKWSVYDREKNRRKTVTLKFVESYYNALYAQLYKIYKKRTFGELLNAWKNDENAVLKLEKKGLYENWTPYSPQEVFLGDEVEKIEF